MKNCDLMLSELRTKVARKKHLKSILPEMKSQRLMLEQKQKDLEIVKLKEQHDVEKIEGGSLASFFYNVVGKKDEKLDKERQEAYEAKVKYDLATAELQALNDDIVMAEYEYIQLLDCEKEYEEAFRKKLDYIKSVDPDLCNKLEELESNLAYVEQQNVEVQQAILAGQSALSASNDALERLDDAERWSNWDIFSGGFFVDVAKHSALDNTQAAIELLQYRLRRFKTELADITIHTEINVKIEGFLQFADYFFDGIFVDWIVRDKIHSSYESLQSTHDKIQTVLKQLKEMQQRMTSKEIDLKRQIEEIVISQ